MYLLQVTRNTSKRGMNFLNSPDQGSTDILIGTIYYITRTHQRLINNLCIPASQQRTLKVCCIEFFKYIFCVTKHPLLFRNLIQSSIAKLFRDSDTRTIPKQEGIPALTFNILPFLDIKFFRHDPPYR